MSLEVKALLEEYWDMKLPVDPKFFAEKLGLTIHEASLGYLSGYFDEENKEIWVNEDHPEERKRFTIAHELGHFCLGHGSSLRDTTKQGWYGQDDPRKEAAANNFAAELLMPEVAVRFLMDENGVRDTTVLRTFLGVSNSALAHRLRNLGYIRS